MFLSRWQISLFGARSLGRNGMRVEINEAHHGRVETDRQTDGGMTGGTFHRVSHG